MQGRISPRAQLLSGSWAWQAVGQSPCSHLVPQGPSCPGCPCPAALTWGSFPAKRSCRGSLLLSTQLSPGPENTECGMGWGVTPTCPSPVLPPLQPGAASQGFTSFPSPPAMTQSRQDGEDTPSLPALPRPGPQLGQWSQCHQGCGCCPVPLFPGMGVQVKALGCPELYLLPGGVPELLAR